MKFRNIIVMTALAATLLAAAGCFWSQDEVEDDNTRKAAAVTDFTPYRTVVIARHRAGIESADADTIALLEDLQKQLAATDLFDKVVYTCEYNHNKSTMVITTRPVKGQDGVIEYTVTDVLEERVLACEKLGGNEEFVKFIAQHTKR